MLGNFRGNRGLGSLGRGKIGPPVTGPNFDASDITSKKTIVSN